jgi:5-methylcytosine-specific restriction endonuclease McrA
MTKTPEEIRAAVAANYSKHPERKEARLAYEVEYRSSPENKQKKKEYDKQYRESWTEERKQLEKERLSQYDYVERTRLWRVANPEKTKLLRIAAQGRRRSAGEKHRFSVEDVIALYGTDCHICKEAIDMEAPRKAGAEGWERSLWLDHDVALSKGGGHTLENVKPSHARCNLKKSAS